MNRYRVVPNWDELGKDKEVVVEADYFKSSTIEGKPVTAFWLAHGKKKSEEDDELISVFWGQVIVIKMPCLEE